MQYRRIENACVTKAGRCAAVDPEATLATVRFTVADRPCTSNLLLRRYLRCGFSVCVVLGLSIITPFTATTAKSGTVTANHAAASERGATLKYE